MPFYPVWAFVYIVIAALVVYALAVYGGDRQTVSLAARMCRSGRATLAGTFSPIDVSGAQIADCTRGEPGAQRQSVYLVRRSVFGGSLACR